MTKQAFAASALNIGLVSMFVIRDSSFFVGGRQLKFGIDIGASVCDESVRA
jgi:hypothetical protein